MKILLLIIRRNTTVYNITTGKPCHDQWGLWSDWVCIWGSQVRLQNMWRYQKMWILGYTWAYEDWWYDNVYEEYMWPEMRKRSSNSEFHKCVLLPDSPLLHKQTKSSTKVILIEDPNIAGLASRQIRGEAVKGELCQFLDFPNLNFSFFYHSCHSNKKSLFLWPIPCNFFQNIIHWTRKVKKWSRQSWQYYYAQLFLKVHWPSLLHKCPQINHFCNYVQLPQKTKKYHIVAFHPYISKSDLFLQPAIPARFKRTAKNSNPAPSSSPWWDSQR